MTLDESINEAEDVLYTIDDVPTVIDKRLLEELGEVFIGFDPENGITVSFKK